MRLKIQTVCFVVLSILFSFVLVTESEAKTRSSEQWSQLAANAVTRGYTGPDGDLYRLDVPRSTVVTLDVMTPAVDGNAITMLWDGAEPLDAVYRSATRWVVETSRPKTLELRVVTRNPGRYKIVTRLAARRSAPPTKTDPEVVDPEPEPDGLLGPGFQGPGFQGPADFQTTDPEVVDPEPEPDGLQIDPLTGLGTDCGPVSHGFETGDDHLDDHGDTPSCATPLAIGGRTNGTAGNAWGDDVDVFVLDLDDVTLLELDLKGDVTLTLESAAGNRLAMSEDASGTRLLSLSPGRYVARVEGIGINDAAYELGAASRSW